MSLSGKVNVLLNLTHTKALDLDTLQDIIAETRGAAFTSGTGANQADIIFHDRRTLADNANETLNLYDSGSLLDAFGDAVAITRIKALYIKNNSTDANLLVGAAGATPVDLFGAAANDILKIPPGGEFVLIVPSATGIVISTNKNLKIAHDGTGVSNLTYDIIVLGASS